MFLFGSCSSKIPNTWQSRVQDTPISNIKLHSEIQGKGEPIVLLHGFGSSSYSFVDVAKTLSKKFKVYNLDLKGFGSSPKPDDNRYSPYDQAILVSEFIKKHHLKNVTLIGHSYGGSVALSLALMNQKNIKKMVLISPAAYKQHLPSLIRKMHMPLIGAIGFYLLPSSYEVGEGYRYAYHDDSKIPKKTLENITKSMQSRGAKSAFYSATYDLVPEDIEEISKRYKEITVPTLIIWGEKDVVIKKINGYKLQKDLQNSKLKIIKNCGHIAHEERTHEVVEYLLDFL